MDTFEDAPRFTVDQEIPNLTRGPLIFALKALTLLLTLSTLGVGGTKVVQTVQKAIEPVPCELTFEEFAQAKDVGAIRDREGQTVDWIVGFYGFEIDDSLGRTTHLRHTEGKWAHYVCMVFVKSCEPRELTVGQNIRLRGTIAFTVGGGLYIDDAEILAR